MKKKEVLVIGAGISGCAIALALAKRNIPVTIIASPSDQRTYHASFIHMHEFEDKMRSLQKGVESQLGCSRATDHLASQSKSAVDELLESHYLIDRNGNVDIYRSLQDQLKHMPHVEWIYNHSAIELLTLECHSVKHSDIFKRISCIGAYIYNHETKEVVPFLAKETILATGGATALYPFSSHTSMAKGNGLAMAHRAGARLLNMDKIYFHPIAFYDETAPCCPLPAALLNMGGKIYCGKTQIENLVFDETITLQFYELLLENKATHLWLDLTELDTIALKEQFPVVDAECLNRGFNLAKDWLPIVPIARFTCGGVAIDRVGQSTLGRLRAIGEVACTGLFYDFSDETLGVLESLTWAVSCAEDIAQQIEKFVYYFPEIRAWNRPISDQPLILNEDWKTLGTLMWDYVGINRQPSNLKRGYELIQKLKTLNEEEERQHPFSLEHRQLLDSLSIASLIAQAALYHSYPTKEKVKNFLNEASKTETLETVPVDT